MDLIKLIKQDLKKTKKSKQHVSLSDDETTLIHQIRQETKKWNENNVTRTKAYLDFYMEHPEIHWAFLAHMVSRNGGWNMTDLKGELLIRLLSKKEREMFFSFIERGNWLIFQDAYPQLLLYRESLKKGKSLFFLLPSLNISIFMEIIWNHFWKNKNEALLTTALIVNEQNYIEKRVVQHPHYKNEVFTKLEFKVQDFLSFNHILFPYIRDGVVNLAGLTINEFESLHERILLGKRLYAVLFHKKNVLKCAQKWAASQPHTGSRKDYWPHIFNNIHEGIPGEEYQFQLKSCKLRPGARRIYSPELKSAWKSTEHSAAEPEDWFKDMKVINYFTKAGELPEGDIEDDYCKTLERLELAVLAKKTVSILN